MSDVGLWKATTNAELADIFRDFGVEFGLVKPDANGTLNVVVSVLPEDFVIAESVAALIELPAGIIMRVEPTLRRQPPL